MLAAVTQNDAKTLNKAEKDNDLERYTSRTIGMYKIAVKELEKKKNREKRAAQKASGEQLGEKSTPKPKVKPAIVSGGGAASSDKAQTKVIQVLQERMEELSERVESLEAKLAKFKRKFKVIKKK